MERFVSTNGLIPILRIDRSTLFKYFKQGAPRPKPIWLRQFPDSPGQKLLLWSRGDISRLRQWIRHNAVRGRGRRRATIPAQSATGPAKEAAVPPAGLIARIAQSMAKQFGPAATAEMISRMVAEVLVEKFTSPDMVVDAFAGEIFPIVRTALAHTKFDTFETWARPN